MQERVEDVGGTPTRWLKQGAGLPVVLVHGIPTSPALWRHVMPRLSGMRVLALEMTGYGDSIPAGEGRDLSVGRRPTGWPPGSTRSGSTARCWSGTTWGAAWRTSPWSAGPTCAPLLSRLPAAALVPAFAGLLLRGHDTVQAAREALGVHYLPYARYGGGAAMARQVAALDVADTLAVQGALPGLQVPARVVWGTADQFQKLAYGERFARDLGTTVRRIEGGRHFTPEDSPVCSLAASPTW